MSEKEFKPTVSWFLNKKGLLKLDGQNGEFYKARVFKGTTLPDGKDISGYTYTFNLEKLKEIKAYESSPDFIKDENFRNDNGVIYYNEDTKIKLTEPYDKENPDKELETLVVDAKVLSQAQKNRVKDDSSNNGRDSEKGTKERVTERVVSASNAKSSSRENHELNKEACV